jgi:hypothetical protein
VPNHCCCFTTTAAASLLLLLQVIELSKQNTDLEEEALALEQKLGEAEAGVEKGEKRLAELSAQLASGANGSKEMREKVKEKEVRPHGCATNLFVLSRVQDVRRMVVSMRQVVQWFSGCSLRGVAAEGWLAGAAGSAGGAVAVQSAAQEGVAAAQLSVAVCLL